jgi:hypothetical protein
VKRRRVFYFAHGVPEFCPGINVFTPKGSLLVAQRELFEVLFSNPSRTRHDIKPWVFFQLVNGMIGQTNRLPRKKWWNWENLDSFSAKQTVHQTDTSYQKNFNIVIGKMLLLTMGLKIVLSLLDLSLTPFNYFMNFNIIVIH